MMIPNVSQIALAYCFVFHKAVALELVASTAPCSKCHYKSSIGARQKPPSLLLNQSLAILRYNSISKCHYKSVTISQDTAHQVSLSRIAMMSFDENTT